MAASSPTVIGLKLGASICTVILVLAFGQDEYTKRDGNVWSTLVVLVGLMSMSSALSIKAVAELMECELHTAPRAHIVFSACIAVSLMCVLASMWIGPKSFYVASILTVLAYVYMGLVLLYLVLIGVREVYRVLVH